MSSPTYSVVQGAYLDLDLDVDLVLVLDQPALLLRPLLRPLQPRPTVLATYCNT